MSDKFIIVYKNLFDFKYFHTHQNFITKIFITMQDRLYQLFLSVSYACH